MKNASGSELIKPMMLSIYSGRDCIGFVLNRGQVGFEALDVTKKSLGIFRDEKSAADAISEATP